MDIPPDDGFKWFGEGFDGFPKRLPDDTMEYIIHILDSKLNATQTRSRLNEILKASTELSKKLLKDYIWQREFFSLSLQHENDRWFLSGRTSFGDSIADEWVIVYLLRELSRKFEDAWTRMSDTDGEFLLIEAANALPNWLNPEIAEHRVWMNRGQLRIIPLDAGDTASKNLSLQQALAKTSTDPASLLHSPLIEEEAFHRLRNYPSAITDSMHSSIITIPRKLAYILHAKPSLTSPAVEAFYLRDPISLRPLTKPSPSEHEVPLIFPPADFVTISTRFNKASFAQLKSQDFPIPKAWDHAPFPASSDPKDLARRELGVKLTCGFEMLLQDPQNKSKPPVREIQILLADVEDGADTLPTDAEIDTWPRCEDSEEWMDIDFADFERELAGPSASSSAPEIPRGGKTGGFGDKAAQENLRRMVENFEKWMNEDEDVDGAEADSDLDSEVSSQDRGSDDDDDDDDEEEDKPVSFDEGEFRRAMRVMMGLPEADLPDPLQKTRGESDVKDIKRVEEDEEDEEIRRLTERMEAELFAAGALNLDVPEERTGKDGETKRIQSSDNGRGKGKAKAEDEVEDRDEDDNDDNDEEEDDDANTGAVNIDYNLAKNMLEAFKSQTGLSGPAGNMLGMMGIALPRDEKDEGEKSLP